MKVLEEVAISPARVESLFDDELEKNYIFVSFIGVILQFLWIFTDWVILNSRLTEMLIFRLVVLVVPVGLCLFYKKFNLKPIVCIFVSALGIGLVTLYATCSVSKIALQYYVLGSLVYFVGVGMLATWKIKYSIALVLLNFVFAFIVFIYQSPLPFDFFMTHGGIAISTVACLSIVMISSRYNSRYNELLARIGLEDSLKKIAEKSDENNSLQSQLFESEKNAILGEVISSVSHELNTPLSVVMNGSRAISETLESILLIIRNNEQIPWDLIMDIQTDLSSRNKEISNRKLQSLVQSLSQKFEKLTNKKLSIISAKKLAWASFKESDDHYFVQLSNHENFNELIDLILKLKELNDFNKSISDSVYTTSRIIQQMKSIAEIPEFGLSKKIGLKDSIEKALYVFNQFDDRNSQFKLDIEKELVIYGNEIRLIQLWTKLFSFLFQGKNESEDNMVELSAHSTSELIVLHIIVSNEFESAVNSLYRTNSLFDQNGKLDNNLFDLNLIQSYVTEFKIEVDSVQKENKIDLLLKFKI